MAKIGTVINFCSLDYRFIRYCVQAAAPFSHKVVVSYADHLFDGTAEDIAVIEKARGENPEADFVQFAYHHSITEMLRSRFWHNFARWVGLSHLPAGCDWVLFLDADEIVESDRFAAFLLKGGFLSYDYLYFANYWYFREPRFRAQQIEDSPAMVKRTIINVNRIFHENERATFRRLPNGLRRVAGPDGRPMFHHYSWVMTEDEMLSKVRSWGHSFDTDRDWEALIKSEFLGEFSGKDFVHGYDYEVVEPLIRLDFCREKEMTPYPQGMEAPSADQRGAKLSLNTPCRAPGGCYTGSADSNRKSEKSQNNKRIGFHSNQLGLRGTEVALYDYAFYNQEALGNESVIISDARGDLQGLAKFQETFEVLLYEEFSQVERFVEKRGIEAVYFQKAGHNDGKLVSNARNLVHAVFQSFEPHGEVYAYISRWLAHKMAGGRQPFVPHMVRLPEIAENFRRQLNIPSDAVVFGRHGGRDQFDIPYVHRVVQAVARARKDLYFLFMNTDRFCEPMANIIHLNPTWDLAAKAAFINTCDAMLHARIQGETFGLAIAEFLLRDKPVIACMDGVDQNHVEMLGDSGLFYREPVEVFDLLMEFRKADNCGQYRELVAEFSPQRVMQQFEEVFLSA